MDITSLMNVSSGAVREAEKSSGIDQKASAIKETPDMFSSFLNSAMDSLKVTNGYYSDAENEEIKLSLGQTDNTHDLSVALQKASTALQYTVAVRDKALEAYREIMQMQI